MGKCCLHAGSFIFDWIIIKVAGNQDRHKSSDEFDFGPDQTTHFGVTCPWMTKILHFQTWISLRQVGQSWSNFMSSITGSGERLHNVLRQIGSKLWCPWQQIGIPVMRYERAARPCALNFRLAALKSRFGRPPNALSSIGVWPSMPPLCASLIQNVITLTRHLFIGKKMWRIQTQLPVY